MLKPGDLVRIGCDPSWSFPWQCKAAKRGTIFEVAKVYLRVDGAIVQVKDPDSTRHWITSNWLEPPF